MKKIIMCTIFILAGCSSDQIQKDNAWLVANAPQVVSMVNIGLVISGNGVLVPINNAGIAALNALRLSVMGKQGISQDAAEKLTTVIDLGLVATEKGELVSINDKMAADLGAAVFAVKINSK